MRRSFFKRFVTDQGAAIAPLYALGIGVFVTMSAIGFDYGRLMALDTELQNAADEAALAAATQLDGSTNAMANARNAANTKFASTASTFTNETRFANDQRVTGAQDPRPITSLSFRFFDAYNGTTDAPGTVLTTDTQSPSAKVVEVTVNARRVFYALTPLVRAINSGDVIGRALAGLESSTCNVPPMMFCLPQTGGVVDINFPTSADLGKGLKLHMNANAADPWAPGNFGFLDINYTYPNGTNPNHTLGFNEAFSGCTGEVIESETGVRTPQSDALNSRFDMYENSMNNNSCAPGTGNYCPAENVRRDWVNLQSFNNKTAAEVAAMSCSSNASNNWALVSSLPTTGDLVQVPPAQGLPEDNCFVSGSCTVVGTTAASVSSPNWNATAYMALHHGSTSLSTAAPNGTRYEVYKWEIANKATELPSPKVVGYNGTAKGSGKFSGNLYCAFPRPVIGTAIPATSTQKDRRVLTVAAVDCTGLHGSSPVKIMRWVDLFLVKPANQNGSQKEFFTEIIGPAKKADNSTGFQYFGRHKAVLIR
ncbi:MAG: pilus assembly protein TadG-related protein [Novosphingobium sp.]